MMRVQYRQGSGLYSVELTAEQTRLLLRGAGVSLPDEPPYQAIPRYDLIPLPQEKQPCEGSRSHWRRLMGWFAGNKQEK